LFHVYKIIPLARSQTLQDTFEYSTAICIPKAVFTVTVAAQNSEIYCHYSNRTQIIKCLILL